VGQESEITPTAFVVWPPQFTGGNKAHGVLAGNSIVKMAGSVREEVGCGAPLTCGEGPRLYTELPVALLGPCVGFPFA
jgi:hypothetical protein